jgi:hypothetical protein
LDFSLPKLQQQVCEQSKLVGGRGGGEEGKIGGGGGVRVVTSLVRGEKD